MEVHPGCPVCSIVAASLAAAETDVGKAISAAKVAFVCGLWSVGVQSLPQKLHLCVVSGLLELLRPFSYFCIHQLLFPCLEVLVESASPLLQSYSLDNATPCSNGHVGERKV